MKMLRYIKDHNKKGQQAENIALDYLQTQGLKPIQANFTCKCGEIDLIMQDNNYLVFIEVRYRKHIRFGHPLETINNAKQKKIIKTIHYFLMKNPSYNQLQCRIDAVAIHSQPLSEQAMAKQPQIEWVKNVIQA